MMAKAITGCAEALGLYAGRSGAIWPLGRLSSRSTGEGTSVRTMSGAICSGMKDYKEEVMAFQK
jgi:hypothetical protein